MNQTTLEQTALAAAFQLHQEMLAGDAFAGYTGEFHYFEELFRECLYIAREEANLEIDPIEQIVETYYTFQAEISSGERSAFYWA